MAAFDVRKERLKVFSEIHGQGYEMFCLWYLLEKGTVPEKEGSIVLGRTVPRAQLSFPGQQPTSKDKGHPSPPAFSSPLPIKTFAICVFIRLQVRDGHSAGREVWVS